MRSLPRFAQIPAIVALVAFTAFSQQLPQGVQKVTAVEGITANANAGNAARWDWMSSPVNARLVQDRMMAMGRFAAQTGRSRFNVDYEYQKRCEGPPLSVETVCRAASARNMAARMAITRWPPSPFSAPGNAPPESIIRRSFRPMRYASGRGQQRRHPNSLRD